MKSHHHPLRVVTYNIHKCRGLDRRVRPDRIAGILKHIDADIIALQEVLSIEGHEPEKNQLQFIAKALGFYFAFGETRRLKGGSYGNAVLSRFPIHVCRHYDISKPGCEPRGCLRTDIEVPGSIIHVFNVHFGTALLEHRQQARRLFEEEIVNHREVQGARIVLGDFNEWMRGIVSRTLKTHLQHADIRYHLKRSRTYPGVLPIFHLDHIYFDQGLKLENLHLYRSRPALVASDHLPLVAEFRLIPKAKLLDPIASVG